MRTGLPRSLRTILGMALMFIISIFSFEGVTADVHDGHENSSEVTATSDQAPGSHKSSTTPSDGHDVHLCHCVHTHVAVTPALHMLTSSPQTVRTMRPPTESFWTSRTVAPDLRPPIA